MTQCTALATKAELEALRRLLDNKLDKTERNSIINEASAIAVPLATAAAAGQLLPSIKAATAKAGQALAATAANAGKIVGLLSSVAGILLQLGSLALVAKHEFVDLPQIRQDIKANRTLIDLNFKIVLENKRKIFEQERILEAQAKQIDLNRKQILRNEDNIAQNKLRIAENYSLAQQNKADIDTLRTETEQSLQQLDSRLTSELQASEARLQAKLDAQKQATDAKIAQVQTDIAQVQTDINLKNAVLQGLIIGLQNTFSNFRANTATKPEVNNVNQGLVTVRRKVGTVENVANIALNTAQNAISFRVSSPSTATTNTTIQSNVQILDNKTKKLETKITNLENNSTVNDQQIKDLRNGIKSDNEALLAGLGIAGLPFLINQIRQNQLTQDQVKAATNTAICESSSGGCLTNNVTNPLKNIMDNLKGNLDLINAALNSTILEIVRNTNTVVNSGWASATIDKTLNAANFALSLHNAVMLSNNVADTVLETIDVILDIMGVTDFEGNPIDISKWLTDTLRTVVQGVVGAETYTDLSIKLTAANRIYQAGMSILDNVTDLIDTSMELDQYTGENISKIGNALRDSGIVPYNAYEQMIEDLDNRKFSKWLTKIEQAEEVTDNIYSIAENIKSIQEIGTELKESREEFDTALEESKTAFTEAETELDTEIESIPEPTEEDEARG